MRETPETQLRCYLNWLSLDGLQPPPDGWMRAIRDAGYDGIQLIEPLELPLWDEARAHGLGVCGSGRVNQSPMPIVLPRRLSVPAWSV
jgi:sugar phosphate isomerase/epimerase